MPQNYKAYTWRYLSLVSAWIAMLVILGLLLKVIVTAELFLYEKLTLLLTWTVLAFNTPWIAKKPLKKWEQTLAKNLGKK